MLSLCYIGFAFFVRFELTTISIFYPLDNVLDNVFVSVFMMIYVRKRCDLILHKLVSQFTMYPILIHFCLMINS